MQWRRLLFIPPILIGIGVFKVMTSDFGGSDVTPPVETAFSVRVQTISAVPVQASTSGYGRVQAERTWSAIAQVTGRVVQLPERLAVGRIYDADTLLVQTDPKDYEIAKAKHDAELASAKAEMAEIDVEERNTQASLKLEREVEELLKVDYDRMLTLSKKGTVSKSSTDDSQRTLLAQRKVVTNLENTMARYPAKRVTLLAGIQTVEADLQQAERDLENTEIRAPFAGRVASKSIEIGQYVRTGDTLLTLEAVDAAEIVAEFQPIALGNFLRSVVPSQQVHALNFDGKDGPLKAFELAGVRAEVVVNDQGRLHRWDAEIARFTGTADSDTGTIGIVVRVPDPIRPDVTKGRRPLTTGTFAEVVLSATGKAGLLIPREALYTDPTGETFVYVMDGENRLRRRVVQPGPVVGQNLLVRDGLSEGDNLVVSTPQPAVLGMLLKPVTAGS